MCREGRGDLYRWYDDNKVSGVLTWQEVCSRSYVGTSLGVGCYVLVYVRDRFWGAGVGDGSERTPYLRDSASVDAAKRFFRQRPV